MHDAAKAADVKGNPNTFLDEELCTFIELVRNTAIMSPWDSRGIPTLQALGWMDVQTPYDAKTTQTLAIMILSAYARKK